MIESSREGIANHRSLGYGCLALVLAAVPLVLVGHRLAGRRGPEPR